MAQKKKAASLSGGQKVGIGIGMTAAMLGAVGGYFLYGAKDAKRNRKTVNSWMLKAKAEVLEGIENAKELTEKDYDKLVDEVMKGYKAARSASVKDLGEFGVEMKKHWKQIKQMGEQKKAVIPVVKATAKKPAAKKPAPKKK
jgi:hypothetical protein